MIGPELNSNLGPESRLHRLTGFTIPQQPPPLSPKAAKPNCQAQRFDLIAKPNCQTTAICTLSGKIWETSTVFGFYGVNWGSNRN